MDRHRAHVDALVKDVLEQPGTVTADLRRAACDNTGDALPAQLAAYVDKVARHAHQVTDQEVAALKEAGYSEDQLFEITVAAAVGAALRRLDAALGKRGR